MSCTARSEASRPQIESKYAMFVTLKVLLKQGYINEATFNNVVKHKFSEYAA